MWAAVVAPADEIGGQYCENCHVAKSYRTTRPSPPSAKAYADMRSIAKNAEALWKKSEELVGESF